MSPSSRRAWIEIDYAMPNLKLVQVALLAEGVDRNRCFDPEKKSMADVLTLEAKLGDVIQIPDYKNFRLVDVAPSCMSMIFANQRLTLETMRPRHDRLRHALEQHRED